MTFPIQPVYKDDQGILRFRANKVVKYLLDNGSFDMNHIARCRFPMEDQEQFAQLIGYSVSGFGDLSYASSDTFNAAYAMAEKGLTEEQARISCLESELKSVKDGLRETVANLYGIAPEDLK